MAQWFFGSTEFRRFALTFNFGSVADVDKVGIAIRTDANDIPDAGPSAIDLGEFTEVTLDSSDILVKIGPWNGDINPAVAGLYQIFTLVQTVGGEKIIDKPDTLDVVGA